MNVDEWCRQFCTKGLGWSMWSRDVCREKTSCREYRDGLAGRDTDTLLAENKRLQAALTLALSERDKAFEDTRYWRGKWDEQGNHWENEE
jgi:hypothetical protein